MVLWFLFQPERKDFDRKVKEQLWVSGYNSPGAPARTPSPNRPRERQLSCDTNAPKNTSSWFFPVCS